VNRSAAMSLQVSKLCRVSVENLVPVQCVFEEHLHIGKADEGQHTAIRSQVLVLVLREFAAHLRQSVRSLG
jgi:hypothetical protein